jgi:RimJ/RimL family protein N-acetyltransferase
MEVAGQLDYSMESAMPRSDYLFSSKRLGFRLIEDADFDMLKELDTDPAVRSHFPEGALTPEQIKDRLSRNKASYRENGFGDFAVIELETGQFTGRAGFARVEGGEIEVGYVFLRRFWGRGLAQESLRALLNWAGHNLDVPRIIAYAPRQHSASFNVMKKAGMRYFKTEKERGVECDFYEYSL